jgi:hypothetical protein
VCMLPVPRGGRGPGCWRQSMLPRARRCRVCVHAHARAAWKRPPPPRVVRSSDACQLCCCREMAACTAVSRGRRLAPLYRALPLADSARCGGPLAGLVAVAMFMVIATLGSCFRVSCTAKCSAGDYRAVMFALMGRDGAGALGGQMLALSVLHPFVGAVAVPVSVLEEHFAGPAASAAGFSRRFLLGVRCFAHMLR